MCVRACEQLKKNHIHKGAFLNSQPHKSVLQIIFIAIRKSNAINFVIL